jgi:hypothetical protein
MSGLSLWTIEDALIELLDARAELLAGLAANEDPERREELATVERTLAEYVEREVGKVDGIHSYLRYAEHTAAAAREEATRMTERARVLEASAERLKRLVVDVMDHTGKKRLEGHGGRLLRVQGNGGLPPLIVDPGVLPDEYVDVTIRVSLADYKAKKMEVKILDSQPADRRIREALAAGPVPGAYLGERGQHLRLS